MEKRKNQLILIISLFLIAGFLITSLASYFVSRSSLREQISQNELPLTSDNIYSEIQRDILRPIFISSLMATDTFLRDWLIQGEKDSTQIIRYLKEIKTKYNTFTSFFVSEQTRIYYHADGILKKVSPDEERDNWYFRVRSMKEDYEINFDPDQANKDALTIFINYRVYDYAGKYIGTTGVGLAVNSVKDLIANYKNIYDRDIYFVDQEGNIKLHSGNLSANEHNISNLEGLGPLSKEILAAKSHSFQYKRKGKTVHLNTRFISEFKWFLLVEKTEETAIKQILDTLMLNLLICVLIIAVVIYFINLTINAYQHRLEKIATTDKLTGLYNRQAFDILFSETFKDAKRRNVDFSVIEFDLDRFKKINDAHGHLAGDAVLKNIADIAFKNIRTSDVVCRWGGEEFLIILKDCDLEHGYNMAEKLRLAIKNFHTDYNGKNILTTASLGVAQYRKGESEDELYNRVDKALYAAKQNGRDRTEKEI